VVHPRIVEADHLQTVMGHDHVEELVRTRQAVEDVTYTELAMVDSARHTILNPCS
jgi:hypothetical protein